MNVMNDMFYGRELCFIEAIFFCCWHLYECAYVL